MATLTRAQMGDRILENLGLKAAGQSARAEDATTALEAFDGVYQRLRRTGQAPFPTSAVPEYAQRPLIAIASYELKDHYGIAGERLQSLAEAFQRATNDLAAQTSGKHDPRVRTKARYY